MRVAASASLLYAKNLFAFLETMIDKSSGTLAVNRDDELVKRLALEYLVQVAAIRHAGKLVQIGEMLQLHALRFIAPGKHVGASAHHADGSAEREHLLG